MCVRRVVESWEVVEPHPEEVCFLLFSWCPEHRYQGVES